MTNPKQSIPQRAGLLAALVAAALVLRALWTGADPMATLSTGGNDDIMRLLSVRDWLAGQGWFDMSQTRVLPPDGLSLHWSRYVDLGIAALLVPLTALVGAAKAEALTLIWWPTLLMLGVLALTWHLGRRALGVWAAALACLAAAVWPLMTQNFFGLARLDHHNVQILLMTAMVLTLIQPGLTARGGAWAGLAAAGSLAVGLENLLPIALAGLILCARVCFDPAANRGALMGFAGALALASLALFAGQTAPAQWAVAQCDQLSLPFLAIAGAAAAVSGGFVWIAPKLGTIWQRAGALGLLSGASLALLAPLIAPCLAGPYAQLSPQVQRLIYEGITEALPLSHYLTPGSHVPFTLVAPALGAVLTGATVLALRTRAGQTQAGEARVVLTLIVFALMGLIGSLFQIRMILMSAPAAPLLAGYALVQLAAMRRAAPGRAAPGLGLVAGVILTLGAPYLYVGVVGMGASIGPAAASAITASPTVCRLPTSLAALTSLPQGTIAAPGSISTSILLGTDHSVLAAPYHRSGPAIANAALPFQVGPEAFAPHLADLGADYLLLCASGAYMPGSGADRLVAGEALPGLTPVALSEDSPLRVYKVHTP